jgi:hypothetical protein
MNAKKIIWLSLCVAAVAPGSALALDVDYEITIDRCTQDSLNPDQARGRTKWAVKCGLLSARKADTWLHDDNGQPLARPMHPIFVTADNSRVWSAAPTVEAAACDTPPEFTRMFGCLSSCYAPGERLAFVIDDREADLMGLERGSDGAPVWIKIENALKANVKKVLTLSPSSHLDNLVFAQGEVMAYSKERVDAWNDILTIRTASGGRLRVTPNHPIVDGTGRMREAGSFKVGDEFVRYDGLRDPVESIETARHFGQVYNLDTKSPDLKGKIVLAEGYLNGTYYYQNRGFGHINRQLLREQLAEEIVP